MKAAEKKTVILCVESDEKAQCAEEGDVGRLTSETPEQEASGMCQSSARPNSSHRDTHTDTNTHTQIQTHTPILLLDGQASITCIAPLLLGGG